MASKLSNFIGLFEYFRTNHNVKAKEVVKLINDFPEFVYQNKRDLLNKKVKLIKEHSLRNDIYIRNLLTRHPDIFLK